jgi:hypothetical protein
MSRLRNARCSVEKNMWSICNTDKFSYNRCVEATWLFCAPFSPASTKQDGVARLHTEKQTRTRGKQYQLIDDRARRPDTYLARERSKYSDFPANGWPSTFGRPYVQQAPKSAILFAPSNCEKFDDVRSDNIWSFSARNAMQMAASRLGRNGMTESCKVKRPQEIVEQSELLQSMRSQVAGYFKPQWWIVCLEIWFQAKQESKGIPIETFSIFTLWKCNSEWRVEQCKTESRPKTHRNCSNCIRKVIALDVGEGFIANVINHSNGQGNQ